MTDPKVSKEEMLEWLRTIKMAAHYIIESSDKGPEVDEEAVEKCINRLHYWSREANKPSEEFIRNRINDLLREAGVRVREGK